MINSNIIDRKNQLIWQLFEKQADRLTNKDIPIHLIKLFHIEEFKLYALEIIHGTQNMNFMMFLNEYLNALRGYQYAYEQIKINPLNSDGPFLMEKLRKAELDLLLSNSNQDKLQNIIKISTIQNKNRKMLEYSNTSHFQKPSQIDIQTKKQIRYLEKQSSHFPIMELFSIRTFMLSFITQVSIDSPTKMKWEFDNYYPTSIFIHKDFERIGQKAVEINQELYQHHLVDKIAEISKSQESMEHFRETGQIIAQQIQSDFNSHINSIINFGSDAINEMENFETEGQTFATSIRNKIQTTSGYIDFAEKFQKAYQMGFVSYADYWNTSISIIRNLPLEISKEIIPVTVPVEEEKNTPLQQFLDNVSGNIVEETDSELVVKFNNSSLFMSKDFQSI